MALLRFLPLDFSIHCLLNNINNGLKSLFWNRLVDTGQDTLKIWELETYCGPPKTWGTFPRNPAMQSFA